MAGFGVSMPFLRAHAARAKGGLFMLQVQNLTIVHQKDLRVLIKDLSFTLSGTERLAVIGEEGDGKTTLLHLICSWPEVPSWCLAEGMISSPSEKLAFLPQEISYPKDLSVYDFCCAQSSFRDAAWEDLYDACEKTGLSPDFLYTEQPVAALSGGERIKLRLTLLLLSAPTMLVLDEPSNDLDLSALDTLQRFLLNCALPVIFVSHDEYLLTSCATRVLHLESIHGRQTPKWTLSNTTYETYCSVRQESLAKQEQQFQADLREKQARDERFLRIQQSVEHAQNAISRRDPHGGRLLKKKMKAVKSLEHRFEREDRQMTERPNTEWAIDASWLEGISVPAGKKVLDLDLPELRAGEHVLCRDLHLSVCGPEKIFILGDNGVGKTTLLKHIASLMLERKDLVCSYMPQNYEDVLPGSLTPVEFLHSEGTKDQLTRIRIYLGAFRFTREEMEHPICGLSGGQKAKLLLIQLILKKANVLVLDEPTRNLSPLSAPVFRDMLFSFQGCVICVTHDRLLLSSRKGRLLRLTEHGLVPE